MPMVSKTERSIILHSVDEASRERHAGSSRNSHVAGSQARQSVAGSHGPRLVRRNSIGTIMFALTAGTNLDLKKNAINDSLAVGYSGSGGDGDTGQYGQDDPNGDDDDDDGDDDDSDSDDADDINVGLTATSFNGNGLFLQVKSKSQLQIHDASSQQQERQDQEQQLHLQPQHQRQIQQSQQQPQLQDQEQHLTVPQYPQVILVSLQPVDATNTDASATTTTTTLPQQVITIQPPSTSPSITEDPITVIDLSRYRLPNLLENKLRRMSLREQRVRNPRQPATRVIFADFSMPHVRQALTVDTAPKQHRKRSRRKGRRGSKVGGSTGSVSPGGSSTSAGSGVKKRRPVGQAGSGGNTRASSPASGMSDHSRTGSDVSSRSGTRGRLAPVEGPKQKYLSVGNNRFSHGISTRNLNSNALSVHGKADGVSAAITPNDNRDATVSAKSPRITINTATTSRGPTTGASRTPASVLAIQKTQTMAVASLAARSSTQGALTQRQRTPPEIADGKMQAKRLASPSRTNKTTQKANANNVGTHHHESGFLSTMRAPRREMSATPSETMSEFIRALHLSPSVSSIASGETELSSLGESGMSPMQLSMAGQASLSEGAAASGMDKRVAGAQTTSKSVAGPAATETRQMPKSSQRKMLSTPDAPIPSLKRPDSNQPEARSIYTAPAAAESQSENAGIAVHPRHGDAQTDSAGSRLFVSRTPISTTNLYKSSTVRTKTPTTPDKSMLRSQAESKPISPESAAASLAEQTDAVDPASPETDTQASLAHRDTETPELKTRINGTLRKTSSIKDTELRGMDRSTYRHSVDGGPARAPSVADSLHSGMSSATSSRISVRGDTHGSLRNQRGRTGGSSSSDVLVASRGVRRGGRGTRRRVLDIDGQPLAIHQSAERARAMAECDKILARFESYHIPIDRKVLEGGLVVPEDVFKPPRVKVNYDELIRKHNHAAGHRRAAAAAAAEAASACNNTDNAAAASTSVTAKMLTVRRLPPLLRVPENTPCTPVMPVSPTTPAPSAMSTAPGTAEAVGDTDAPMTSSQTALTVPTTPSKQRRISTSYARKKTPKINIGMILVKPATAPPREDQDRISAPSKINCWWTPREFRELKENVKKHRQQQREERDQKIADIEKIYLPQAHFHESSSVVASMSSKFSKRRNKRGDGVMDEEGGQGSGGVGSSLDHLAVEPTSTQAYVRHTQTAMQQRVPGLELPWMVSGGRGPPTPRPASTDASIFDVVMPGKEGGKSRLSTPLHRREMTSDRVVTPDRPKWTTAWASAEATAAGESRRAANSAASKTDVNEAPGRGRAASHNGRSAAAFTPPSAAAAFTANQSAGSSWQRQRAAWAAHAAVLPARVGSSSGSDSMRYVQTQFGNVRTHFL